MLAAQIEAADPFGEAIAALLKADAHPFFVQVGGFDGESFDPLRPHIVAGDLGGIIVEPIPQYFEKLQALYAGSDKVRAINCAISDADGERTIWRFNPLAVERGILPPHFAGISSFLMEELLKDTGVLGRSSPNAETTAALRALLEAVPVQCRTMNSLLRECGVEKVDILQIDTEGYDFEILKFFDFDRFRPAIVHYEHQHLQPPDAAAAEALLRGYGYRIHREDYDTLAVLERPAALGPMALERLRDLALRLGAEGRGDDALLLLEHLRSAQPNDLGTLREIARLHGREGRRLEALEALVALRHAGEGGDSLVTEIQAQAPAAVERFNAHLAAGEGEAAARYARALATLIPGNAAVLGAALSCSQALGRTREAAQYAAGLLRLEPGNLAAHAALAEGCKASGELDGEIEHRMAVALSPQNPAHPLLRLRDLHDLASYILCRPLTGRTQAWLTTVLGAARELRFEVPQDGEWTGWEKHYRVMLDALDPAPITAPTPAAAPEPKLKFATASGAKLDWKGVKAAADRAGAKAVFFAAADEAYVELYARWYVLSVLKHCDAPCLVVVHVIGGANRLKAIAQMVGVTDERLVFAGDDFDAAAVETRCYDAPPKGLIEKPVAHFQSVRFLRLGGLLERLGRPVFVSDIDLLLQRGVQDLLARTAEADIVFNENQVSSAAGSRLTANLMLVNPTEGAAQALRFLAAYLETQLGKAEVTRWIDQVALLMTRHHLQAQRPEARIGYFDTNSDINNVMYTSYQEHPFRFLSLYHGFDTSSLEGDPRVLGAAE